MSWLIDAYQTVEKNRDNHDIMKRPTIKSFPPRNEISTVSNCKDITPKYNVYVNLT